MLMLYLFKVEVFDLGLDYPYSSDYVVVADTHEDRGRLLQRQFGDRNRSVLKRSVLLGARALTLAETRLLETSFDTTDHLWLVTQARRLREEPPGRPLPRLCDESSMYEMLERSPEHLDMVPFRQEQLTDYVWPSRVGRVAAIVRAAA